MRSARRRLATTLAALLLAPCAEAVAQALNRPPASDATLASTDLHALIIGVSHVPGIPALARLQGVAADVSDMRSLALSLGVPSQNLTVLSDAEPGGQPPTLARILGRLRALERRLDSGSQVLIYLSGHGGQQPIVTNSFDAGSEFDGLDEVFLAADALPYDWAMHTMPGVLTDNALGASLQTLASKGVQVWLVVDSCHAGTMSRSKQDESAYFTPTGWRGASLLQMGLDQGSAQWRALVGQGLRIRVRLGALAPAKETRQSLPAQFPRVTAFYATPEQGMAMEVRPKHASVQRGPGAQSATPASEAPVHGLFTYLLVDEARRLLALPGASSILSYRLLMQRLLARYRTQAPTDAPKPQFEGVDAGTWFGRPSGSAHTTPVAAPTRGGPKP